MIKTLFYFANTEAEYLENVQNIAPYTIVFCKDTGTIWRDGKKYGVDNIDVIQGLTARIEELERKVEYYHPEEEDAVDSITWSDYSINPSTVPVGLAATFIPGTVMAVYKSGRQEEVTSSAVFNAHRGSIADHTYIAPSTAGGDTIIASYNGKVADSVLTVTIEDKQGPTVEVGHGANYDDAIFTDTARNLSDNMPVTLDNNAGDYIFIKVGKDETVNNLYIHNEGAGIFEYMEIALDEPQIVGDYKYYKSTNRYNADTAVPYVINKV